MSTATLSPYLTLDGNCKEAMEFYKSCMGGKLTMQTFGAAPMPSDEKMKDKIMHASLENGTLSFMASDSAIGSPVKGDNVNLSVAGDDEEGLKKMFHDLSAGGNVTMKLEKQFWGDTFGMFTDKFGIHWMFNISGKK